MGVLVRKINAKTSQTVILELCELLQDKKDVLRDVASMAIKTIISQLPSDQENLLTILIPRLLEQLKQDSVSIDVIDILSQTFSSFTKYWATQGKGLIAEIPIVFLALLQSSRAVVRKRCIGAVGNLVLVASDDAVYSFIQKIVEILKTSPLPPVEQINTFINTLGVIWSYF